MLSGECGRFKDVIASEPFSEPVEKGLKTEKESFRKHAAPTFHVLEHKCRSWGILFPVAHFIAIGIKEQIIFHEKSFVFNACF
jgi:hypothetical protein